MNTPEGKAARYQQALHQRIERHNLNPGRIWGWDGSHEVVLKIGGAA
jgi:hypothetical protein